MINTRRGQNRIASLYYPLLTIHPHHSSTRNEVVELLQCVIALVHMATFTRARRQLPNLYPHWQFRFSIEESPARHNAISIMQPRLENRILRFVLLPVHNDCPCVNRLNQLLKD